MGVVLNDLNMQSISVWCSNLYVNIITLLPSPYRAKRELDSHIVVTESWDEFYTKLDHKNVRELMSQCTVGGGQGYS